MYDKSIVFDWIESERKQQEEYVQLIASENYVSPDVLKAQGSILTNRYSEGYPGKRYYRGCSNVDKIEQECIDTVKKLFNCKYANVQPHSGSNANQAVYMALLNPGDYILGMSLDAGGHLTHGHKVNQSGKWFKPISYGLNDKGLIDYDDVEKKALAYRPKMIIAGASAYSRIIDWKKFRKIADKVGAYLLCDMAHYSGLIAAGLYPSPLEHAHVVTSTTHKTLRGPRGGIILSNDIEIGEKINKAVFPGLQGGPLQHVIAAKCIAFKEALQPEFKHYQKQVLLNAKQLAKTLEKNGLKIVSDGTDSHMILVDLTPYNISGKDASIVLECAGIICNMNSIPNDPSPLKPSGIRLGTSAMTTRGFTEKDFEKIGQLICDVLYDCSQYPHDNREIELEAKQTISDMLKKYPLPYNK